LVSFGFAFLSKEASDWTNLYRQKTSSPWGRLLQGTMPTKVTGKSLLTQEYDRDMHEARGQTLSVLRYTLSGPITAVIAVTAL
jgi:hypothetical protein